MPLRNTADNEPAQLFAAYVELTYTPDGETATTHRRRRQWVVLPQLPARLAPGDAPVTSGFSYFEREQRNPQHRAVWTYRLDSAGDFKKTLARTVEAYVKAGWVAGPVVTCEIHPTELAQILKEKKTPYRILNRLKKVASSMHRLDIS